MPSQASTPYTGAIQLSGDRSDYTTPAEFTIRAIAVKAGMADSEVAQAVYVIDYPAILEIDKNKISMYSNSTATINITAKTAGGADDTIVYSLKDAVNIEVDSDIATLSISGSVLTVTGNKTGSANIIITTGSGLSVTCELTLESSWCPVFLDDFEIDGAAPDSDNWTQLYASPAPYSVSGGELKIDGETGSGQDGAGFIYNTSLNISAIETSTRFRATLDDPVKDSVGLIFYINYDNSTGNGYVFVLASELSGDSLSRSYNMNIYKATGGILGDPLESNIEGSVPLINSNTVYLFKTLHSNVYHTMVFSILDEDGIEIATINCADPGSDYYTSGKVGFSGDLNLDASSGANSLYFDYFTVSELR